MAWRAWGDCGGWSDQPRFSLQDLARHSPIVGGAARSSASPTSLRRALFETHVHVDCLRSACGCNPCIPTATSVYVGIRQLVWEGEAVAQQGLAGGRRARRDADR